MGHCETPGSSNDLRLHPSQWCMGPTKEDGTYRCKMAYRSRILRKLLIGTGLRGLLNAVDWLIGFSGEKINKFMLFF